MKSMWVNCKGCKMPVRNSKTSIAKHDKVCVGGKLVGGRFLPVKR